MKRNIICGLAASLLSVTLLVSPAMAQSPGANWDLLETKSHRYFLADPVSPGAGWVLVGSDTVRYFLAGSTPPAGAELADAGRVASILSQDPASNEWLLVSTENFKDFIADGAGSGGTGSSSDQLTSSTFLSTRNEQQVYSAGRHKLSGEPTYDQALWETDTKKWRLTSQTATVRRYDVPVYRNVHTPFQIVDRFGYETRTVDTYDNTYRVSKTVTTASGQELVDTHSYTKREEKATPWAQGAIVTSMDKLVSTGIVHTVQTTYQAYTVDLLAGKVAESDKSQGSKSATFLSDNGMGNTKTALSGSKKRVAFKADEAVASTAKKAVESGSIVDPTVDKAREAEEAARRAEEAKRLEAARLAEQAAKDAAKKAEEEAKEAARKAEEAAKEAAKQADEAAKAAAKKAADEAAAAAKKAEEAAAAAKKADEDSANQAFTLADWKGTFEKDDKRIVITGAGSVPRATLYTKTLLGWIKVGEDGSAPSGSMKKNNSVYNDDEGPNFYTAGDIVLKRKNSGSLEISGKYKGLLFGSFSFDKMKKK